MCTLPVNEIKVVHLSCMPLIWHGPDCSVVPETDEEPPFWEKVFWKTQWLLSSSDPGKSQSGRHREKESQVSSQNVGKDEENHLWGYICTFTGDSIVFSIDRGHKLSFNNTSGRTEVFRAVPLPAPTEAGNKKCNHVFMNKSMHIGSREAGSISALTMSDTW